MVYTFKSNGLRSACCRIHYALLVILQLSLIFHANQADAQGHVCPITPASSKSDRRARCEYVRSAINYIQSHWIDTYNNSELSSTYWRVRRGNPPRIITSQDVHTAVRESRRSVTGDYSACLRTARRTAGITRSELVAARVSCKRKRDQDLETILKEAQSYLDAPMAYANEAFSWFSQLWGDCQGSKAASGCEWQEAQEYCSDNSGIFSVKSELFALSNIISNAVRISSRKLSSYAAASNMISHSDKIIRVGITEAQDRLNALKNESSGYKESCEDEDPPLEDDQPDPDDIVHDNCQTDPFLCSCEYDPAYCVCNPDHEQCDSPELGDSWQDDNSSHEWEWS